MLFPQEDTEVVKQWLIRELEPLCDADPDVLADYVLALFKNDADDDELNKMLNEQLVDFLEGHTAAFVSKAIDTLKHTLFEESIVVALVCIVFLLHVRSALVAILMLPVGVLMAFGAMKLLGLGSNIMSLGGIAIACLYAARRRIGIGNLAWLWPDEARRDSYRRLSIGGAAAGIAASFAAVSVAHRWPSWPSIRASVSKVSVSVRRRASCVSTST